MAIWSLYSVISELASNPLLNDLINSRLTMKTERKMTTSMNEVLYYWPMHTGQKTQIKTLLWI